MHAFVGGVVVGSSARRGRRCSARMGLYGEALQAAAQSYFADLAILHKYIGIPAEVARIEHPLLMTSSVALLAGFGVKLGFESRGSDYAERQRSLHKVLMASFLGVCALGFGGGTLSYAMQQKEIWKSFHSQSALALLVLLSANAILGISRIRSLHTAVGVTACLVLVVHIATGIQLLFT
uniref:Cytochrome b561 domain-containing protein n=1 Tax=Rhodosorus marinus TaxID=101924 RepID=A0A7S2ZGF6_9RHOD|mmetsp:Transcript_18765/g.75364  ORF Transcript_18765/g.75364 Transcript_18765/m.75364 type:complete len:180 (+) Transcript_18765:245-784(+)|eukprot:CAMPEP_0113971856 /NCGR_PEP_ID=MMETSP0011_2-20120614/12723_1 /TAXON_ID=101924 /ORGANISM="Rhodosorus marinus" /LENGTH=179 /DNA_ID=CAMNT_0000987907 /DNA_START=173 /DNA_END=712 /DNA_ORIENTATION=+ /assembly_acc=CAM_ASM_000156